MRETSFAVTAETGQGDHVSLWGRGAVTRFEGREGDLSLGGEVASGMIGADLTREAWSAGLIAARSVGEGGYAGDGEGRVEATLTGLYPWGRLALSERTDDARLRDRCAPRRPPPARVGRAGRWDDR